MKLLRLGLFGAGRIGRIHAHNIAAHPGTDLVVVANPSGAGGRALASSLGAAHTQDAGGVFAFDLDAVVIGSPNGTHLALMLEAVRNGVAVLCEKPIDLDVERVRSAWPEVSTSQVPVMVAFNRRFDPSFAAIKARVDAGHVGKVEQVVITSRDPAPSPREYMASSGGIFRDMTIHDLDMARFFVPDIVEVTARGANVFSSDARDLGDFDSVVVTLRGRHDELVTVVNSRHCAFGYDQRLEVFGSLGMLQAGNAHPTTVALSAAAGVAERDPVVSSVLDRYAEAFRLELAAFVRCLEVGRAPSPSYFDGLRALELASAAEESANATP